MTHDKKPLPLRPPYPDDSNHPDIEQPYSPSLLQSPAFDLTDLGEAQAKKMTRGPSTENDGTTKTGLPECLKVGSPAAQQMSRRLGTESATAEGGVMLIDSLRFDTGDNEDAQWGGEAPRNFEKGDIPEALQPGGGGVKVPAERTEVYMHGALEAVGETKVHGGSVTGDESPEDVWGGEKDPMDRRESDATSPIQMSANLTSLDGPYSDYSPFYNPTNNFIAGSSAPANSNQTGSHSAPPPQRPPPVTTNSSSSDIKGRQDSIASSISSVGFDPGMDLSSLDAVTTRALPGRRGLPAVGMEGWKEDDGEDEVAKTWEEELDRRAKAGAELQRRNEEAQEREKEERLQAEFWEEERRLASIIEGPQKPPKAPSSTSDGSNVVKNFPVPDQSRPVPPIPVDAMANMHIRSPPPPPPSANTTTEIYQIKHIVWTDPSVPNAPLRRSPILLQNANGPCPLLALVNALILSTPAAALREILQLREQVSLELLLDAVFQELMDRGGAAGLPDVGDLFAFLLTLHTGMNVNPRFYLDDSDTYLGDTKCFEKTREMELYGAFKVPLVHGWLPSPSDPVLTALKRRGVSNYEEAQTLLFHEEEIISRVTNGTGAVLATGEDQIIEDAGNIREWMERSKTQLTAHGLEVVKKGLKKGDVAILFRNDHFMTVIGGGDSGALMGLVTDMGFAGHEEVVWERMVDVQGRNNEFLSGDFRPVGGGSSRQPHQEVRSLLDPDEGWETIPAATAIHSPTPGDIVDHDADYALAMQLQEEEDEQERYRRDAEQRQRRHGPSQSMGGQPRNLPPPPTPPRRGGGAEVFTHRPADGSKIPPPPPYERVPVPVPGAQTQNMSAYQQQQQHALAQQRVQGRRASAGATTGTAGIQASGGMSSVRRAAGAAGAAGAMAAGVAGSNGGAQRDAQVGGAGHGRRPSLPGTEQDKDKCVIC